MSIITKYDAEQRPDLTDNSQGCFTIIVAPKNFCAFLREYVTTT